MNKKVLLIDGSRRKRNTYGLLLQIAQLLKVHDIETEILNLFDFDIKDCVGCEACVKGKGCSITDDMSTIMQKILDSDGVILSSPVYMGSVTSRFKTFADRTNKWVHKPETAGKPVLFVSTTAATGLKETKRFFELFATGLGARAGGFISRSGKSMGKPVEGQELSRFLSLLHQDRNDYRPTMNEIVMFNVGKVLALKSDGEDHRFWAEKNWFDKLYYYPCKMNPGKKLFSTFMLRVLSKAMN